MPTKLYKFNLETGEYITTVDAPLRPNGQEIIDVLDATLTPPPDIIPDKYAAIFKRDTGEWILVEDHRQKWGSDGVRIEESGTPYWLPGDNYNSEKRYMTELGPLPDDALLTAPAKPDDIIAKEEMQEKKQTRATAVQNIKVEVDGMVFDGDENSQTRLSRAITAAVATGASLTDKTTWVLADNTIAQPTIQQLAIALRKAGEAQTAVWTIPYNTDTTETE